jgi:hypothetical protein
MMFVPLVFVLMAVSLILQDFSPSIEWAHFGYLHIVAVIYFAAAISLPFPLMLGLAFFTGFLWDAKNLTFFEDADVVQAATNLGTSLYRGGSTFGFSIFVYALLGGLMQGIRPLFRKGHWTIPVILSGVGTFLLLLVDYLWINFRRGGFSFPREIWLHISSTALMTMLLAPFVFLLIDKLAGICGFQLRHGSVGQRRRSV